MQNTRITIRSLFFIFILAVIYVTGTAQSSSGGGCGGSSPNVSSDPPSGGAGTSSGGSGGTSSGSGGSVSSDAGNSNDGSGNSSGDSDSGCGGVASSGMIVDENGNVTGCEAGCDVIVDEDNGRITGCTCRGTPSPDCSGSGGTSGDGTSSREAPGLYWRNRVTLGVGYDPRIAANEAGDMIAAWSYYDATTAYLKASVYHPTQGWTEAQTIFTGGPRQSSGLGRVLDITVAGDGSGFVLFSATGGPQVVRYDPASGFGSSVSIATNFTEFSADTCHIVADQNGNAIAVWNQALATQYDWSVFANRYVAGTGWGQPATLDSKNGPAERTRLSGNAQGSAVAVWEQDDAGHFSIWTNRFDPASGWGTARTIENSAQECMSPEIAMHQAGNAVVAWKEMTISGVSGMAINQLWWNRLLAAPAPPHWSPAQSIQTTMAVGFHAVAISDNYPVVVWTQRRSDASREYISLWGSMLSSSAAERIATQIEDSGGPTNSVPSFILDNGRRGVIAWITNSYEDPMVVSTFMSIERGWEGQQSVEQLSASEREASPPQLAVDGQGNVTAIWSLRGPLEESNQDSVQVRTREVVR